MLLARRHGKCHMRFPPLTSTSTERPVTTTSPKQGLCCDPIQSQGQCLFISLWLLSEADKFYNLKMVFPTSPLTAPRPSRHHVCLKKSYLMPVLVLPIDLVYPYSILNIVLRVQYYLFVTVRVS